MAKIIVTIFLQIVSFPPLNRFQHNNSIYEVKIDILKKNSFKNQKFSQLLFKKIWKVRLPKDRIQAAEVPKDHKYFCR